MQVQRHYSRAPITEAIIDLKVTLPSGFSFDNIQEIHAHISDKFPTKETIHLGSFMLQPGAANPLEASHQLSGFLFRSEDKSRIFQATLAGFTFNRLAPYKTWEEFRDEAKYLWEIYKDVCKPSAVTRAAIRYINRLELPGPVLNMGDYLRTAPQVTPDLPQGQINNFFMQLHIPQEDCMLIINEATVPSTNPEIVSVILDFDLFREQTWKIDDGEIWHFLEKLRRLKNLVFEASITDETRELIA